MNTHTVERADVDVESGFRLRLGKLVIFDERGWILPITFALRCIAVYVINKFLQLVQAHQSSSFRCSQAMMVLNMLGIEPMWPPGKSRIALGSPCSSSK